jgi:hypothetical protein
MFSEIEKEVIYLKAVNELIDSMVNYEIMDILGDDSDSQILFKSSTHHKYFNIILVDFLSNINNEFVEERLSYIDAILSICEKPNFNVNGSINNLKSATNSFSEWLEEEIQVPIWMPSIELETDLFIKRNESIKICGNISKHNFLRLSRTAREIVEILKRNNKDIDIDSEYSLLIFSDFYERFHNDIFIYLGSTIAEFLNNIRWGIHEYLQPEFARSFVPEGGNSLWYKYIYPASIEDEFAKACYWDLMNENRSSPYMRKFEVTPLLKQRY